MTSINTPGMFDSLTNADLSRMHTDLCKSVAEKCAEHGKLLDEAARVGLLTPQGEAAYAAAKVLLASLQQDNELGAEVNAELRRRNLVLFLGDA